MIDFYEMLEFYELLPYWGEATSEYKHLEFNRQKIHSFSFVEAAKNSKLVKELLCASCKLIMIDYPVETAYSITQAIISNTEVDFSNQFDEAWEYIQVLNQYRLISIECIECEKQSCYPDCHDETKIVQHYVVNIQI